MSRIQIKNLGNRTAEVLLFDEIGGWGDTPAMVVEQIQGLDVDELVVRINSPGGDVFDGLTIMNAFLSHPAKVTMIVEGLAASAASFIAVGGGDELIMRPNSELMIHDACGVCAGNAEDMERMWSQLDRASNNLATIYQEKAGGTVEEWRETMRRETWFSADEAVAAGLADRVQAAGDVSRGPAETAEPVEPVSAFAGFRMLNKFHYRGRELAPEPVVGFVDENVQKGDLMRISDELAERLGVSADADADTVLRAVESIVFDEKQDDSEALTAVQDVDAVDDTEVPEDKGEGASPEGDATPVESAAETETEVADDGLTVTVDAQRYEELLVAAKYAEQARRKDDSLRREQIVDTAIRENRISAAARGRWLSAMEADEDGVSKRLAAIPKDLIPRDEIGHGLSEENLCSSKSAFSASIFPAPKV